MEGVLQQIVIGHKTTHKKLDIANGTLNRILAIEQSILKVEEARLKQDARDSQTAKRKSADDRKASKAPSDAMKKGAAEDKKKEKGILSKILGGLAAALGLKSLGSIIGKALGGLGETITKALFGKGTRTAIINAFTTLFGKLGGVVKAGISTLGTLLKTSITGLFGEKGLIAKGVNSIFGPKSSLAKLFGGKISLGNIGDKLIGKTLLAKALKGGGLAAALAGILEFKKTGSATSAGASAAGAGTGAAVFGASGAKLGALLGPKGAAIGGIAGAIIGSFVGEEAAQAIHDSIRENQVLKPILDFIDDFVTGFYTELKDTFDSFMTMIDTVGRAFNRFNEENIQPFIKSVTDFIDGAWSAFTNEIEYWSGWIKDTLGETLLTAESYIFAIGDYLDKTFGPTLRQVEEFLSPIIDPLKELANNILTPLKDGFNDALAAVESFTGFLGGIFKGISGEDAGKGFGSFITQGAKGFFDNVTGVFKNYADGKQQGGFVGRVPNQGGNGDRFGAMLAPGSVVLNQTAAGYQSGGMIPTMLEQGERVYGPNDPSAGAALMLNSMIPRFQEGGLLSAFDSAGMKPDQKAIKSSEAGKKASFKQGDSTSGPIAPGGYIDFIGDGSGFTGELRFFDGKGKKVGSYGGISGQARTAKSSQEQRMNVSGTMNPLPDGSYPLENPMGPGSGAVGSFAAWVNNPSGQIGNRGQVFLHNDIGSNGTAGCIGVELGGARGPNGSTKKFTDFYNQVMPKKVNVDLMGDSGKKFGPGDIGSSMLGGAGNVLKGAGSNMMGMIGGIFDKIAPGMGAEFSKLMGGITNLFGPLGEVLMGGLNLAGEAANQFGSGLYKTLGINEGGGGSTPGGAYGESSLIAAMNKAGYNNKKERAMFLSQMAHESGNFKYDEEIASGAAYEGRSDLGNTQAGDGKRYKGRGYIQLTGRANYDYYGKMVGQDLVNNPDLAKDPNIAADVALAYWKDRGISGPAQSGDVRGVTRIINGGYNGLADREAKYAKYMAQGLQTGGIANMRGTGSSNTASMLHKTQENFASMIADKMQPVVVPVPMGGGGGGDGGVVPVSGGGTAFPNLPAEDNSIVSMEYKYRITMGASV